MERFKLDAEQTDAILELKIYRLARLEILVIQKELDEKRKRAKEIGGLLKRDADLWKIVRDRDRAGQKTYGDARRSEITGEVAEEEYTADDFIIDEDNVVIVTRDGWVKRQKEVKDIASTRVREGDAVLAVLPGSTRATVVFFTNFGVAYTVKITDVPASTGYGEPIQSLFKFKDGEKVVAALSLDQRSVGDDRGGEPRRRRRRSHALAVTSDGYSLRFSLAASSSRAPAPAASSRASPRAPRSSASRASPATRSIIAATRQARAMLCKVEEVNFLSGPGRGVILIKLQKEDDRLLGFIASTRRSRSDDRRDDARRRADDQHREVRRHRPRRQGPRAAAARRVHAGRAPPGGDHADR